MWVWVRRGHQKVLARSLKGLSLEGERCRDEGKEERDRKDALEEDPRAPCLPRPTHELCRL